MQVSVIVLTYYPDSAKLLATLASAICQRDVDFELILADDGSKENRFDLAEAFLKSRGFENYRLVAAPENKGTVQNCLNGLNAATGEYVFLTSPGDLLFDENVLADFYRFAKTHDAPVCFGNAVHYDRPQGTPVMTSPYTVPANPDIFSPDRSVAFRKSCFCDRHWICGAVFFRQRDLALKYFNAIAKTSVYTEDTPSTLFALADGIAPIHYDRNMIFYESGGISTGGNDKWAKLIGQDIRLSVEALKVQYPKDPYVDVAWANACIPSRSKRLCRKLCHPLILLRSIRAKKLIRKQPLSCTEADMKCLQQLLSTESE